MSDVLSRLRAFDENGKLRKSSRVFAPTRPKSKGRKRPETAFQTRLVVALRRRLPEGSLVFHVPNQAALHAKGLTREERKMRAIFLKQMGLVAGMPDLICFIPWSECGCRVIGIECKATKGAQSDTQQDIQKSLDALGVEYFIARDVDSTLEWLSNFVTLKERRL